MERYFNKLIIAIISNFKVFSMFEHINVSSTIIIAKAIPWNLYMLLRHYGVLAASGKPQRHGNVSCQNNYIFFLTSNSVISHL